MTEEDLAYYENYKKSLTNDSLEEAYIGIYNTSPGTSQKFQNDVTSYLPNVSYTDGNNKKTCGAEFLKKI